MGRGFESSCPAITEAKRLRFFSFCCVLFCISLSKAEMTKIFNAFRSKNPFSFSVVSVYSNLSVCCSIKKAATVSSELQKSVRATANFNCCGSPFIFVYSDAIFDRQNFIRSALLNDVSKTIFSCLKIEATKQCLRPILLLFFKG